MKKHIFIICLFMLKYSIILAQGDNAGLLVQSPDGKNVKLIWFFKTWNKEITGFDIKRKAGLEQNWVKLNTEAILPEISLKKNISIVESDKNEAGRIKTQLSKYIAEHKLVPIDKNAMLQNLNTNNHYIFELYNLMANDFDIALMSGFGYIDHSVNKKIDYEYGLFIQGTDVLLAKAKWNYGEIPDLNLISDITAKSSYKKRGIQIIWEADPIKMKENYIDGFNIYRDGIRLNIDPVMIPFNKNTNEFTWFDSSANSEYPIRYSISSETIMDIEGIIKSYTFYPNEHPKEYKKTSIAEITSLGFYFKDGLKISWNFPKEYEQYIKGFYISKDIIPEGYKDVSTLLEPNLRSYIDKTATPATAYIRIRINAIYKDKTIIEGNEKLYNYFPLREPPAPEEIKANTIIENKKVKINLFWNTTVNGDTATNYYRIYTYNELSNKFSLLCDSIKGTKYEYKLEPPLFRNYKFYLTSIGFNTSESRNSDTVSIQIPTMELPTPNIDRINVLKNKVKLEWNYTDIADLKGFRLYMNDKLIADENVLGKNKHDFISDELSKSSIYHFTLQAITLNGITSQLSEPKTITILIDKKNK